MTDHDAATAGTPTAARSTAWQTAVTVLQEVRPPFVPAVAEVATIVVEFPPGDPGTPPHRHPGPAFGYMLEGEMLLEIEGQPERVVHAGETFWEPGGDTIHYQDGNHRTDVRSRYTVTVICPPDQPMLVLVDEEELARRKDRRAPRPSAPGAA
jgi:quercetin dioxygenase-like cupin family protein